MEKVRYLLVSFFVLCLPSVASAKIPNDGRFPIVAGTNNSLFMSSYLPVSPASTESEGGILGLRQISQLIYNKYPGTLLDAERKNDNGRVVYIVRWEPSNVAARGRIITFIVDAENGAILDAKGW